MSSAMPMGGRVTLERMTCSEPDSQVFIRINVNDKIVEIPHCNAGPGKSCSLDHFVNYVQQRRKQVGDFAHVCGLGEDIGYLSFLNQD